MHLDWRFLRSSSLASGKLQKDLFQAHYHGKRYSFGYPACPNLEDQTKLFAADVYKVFRSFPESENVFEMVNPTGGSGGQL